MGVTMAKVEGSRFTIVQNFKGLEQWGYPVSQQALTVCPGSHTGSCCQNDIF